MSASESIYRARGAESGVTESEEQLMHRMSLGSALVADWQYLILAGGPRPCDPNPLGHLVSRDRKAVSKVAADKELIFRR